MPTRPRSPKNRLKVLREAQGLSRKELAERITSRYGGDEREGQVHVSERTVYRWETGETAIPQRYFAELGDIFKVTVDHLLLLDEPNGNGNGGGERQAA